MKKYLQEVKDRIRGLQVKFVQISREENECANHLVKAALAEFMLIPDQTTARGTHPYDGPMAACSIGIRYHGPLPNSSQAAKWVEAEALATITEKNIRSFIWKNIICKYGIPKVLVSDNGKQFDNNAFRDFCSELGIKNHYSSPAHPQANGQVEVTNRSLLKII
ncbi:uncharacterized protein LOC115961243 [Quercus lobata]|uniref:uncharacterized protein LOC115961243 n=1 Tax=Quercus lobata TaxID=97700 RepID=UPI001247025B|nr:uncharacterized protein LOC115961243 [Quercus lobata]